MIKDKAELSLLFKQFQGRLKKKDEFEEGKGYLLDFRKELWNIYQYIFDNVNDEEYSLMPLTKEKTIAYYLYHLNRIEDITCNTLINDRTQIFYENEYQNKIKSPIATTGNELPKEQLVEFSKQLNIIELKNYIKEVFENTNLLLENMTFDESKIKVSNETKNKLISLNSVSTDENAFWLVDYWCKKDYRGLVLMPFTRHQFMHLEACLRIMSKIEKNKKRVKKNK